MTGRFCLAMIIHACARFGTGDVVAMLVVGAATVAASVAEVQKTRHLSGETVGGKGGASFFWGAAFRRQSAGDSASFPMAALILAIRSSPTLRLNIR